MLIQVTVIFFGHQFFSSGIQIPFLLQPGPDINVNRIIKTGHGKFARSQYSAVNPISVGITVVYKIVQTAFCNAFQDKIIIQVIKNFVIWIGFVKFSDTLFHFIKIAAFFKFSLSFRKRLFHLAGILPIAKSVDLHF